MTLTQDQLTESLHNALKAAVPPCNRFCVAGATVTDEGHLEVWHNGTGPVKGDHQVVVAEGPLKFNVVQLSARLKVWIEGQHRREYVDLNAALEIDTSGPAVLGWPWTMRYDPSTGVTVATVTVTSDGTIGMTPWGLTTNGPNVNTAWIWSGGTAP